MGNAVKIRRCRHIKTNGTQCGAPALRKEEFCYFHSQARPERVEVRGEGGEAAGEMLFPLFEDANSIQTMLRQVAMMIVKGTIDNKKAALLLNALRIASSNLKRMEAEKPRAVQVVVDVEKVGKTPVGMTPWSEKPGGHEPEEVEDKAVARTKRAILEEEENARRAEQNRRMKAQLEEIVTDMDQHATEVERWMQGACDKPEYVRELMGIAKGRAEMVSELTRRGRTMREICYVSNEKWDEWMKEREKRRNGR